MISSSTESNLPSENEASPEKNETKEMKSSKKHRFLVSLVLFIEPLLLFGASIFALYAVFPLFGYRMILGIVCILVLTTPFMLLFFFAAFYIFTSLPLSDVQDIVDAKSRTFGLAYACLTGRYAMVGVLLLCASTLIIVGLMRSGIERAFQQQFLYTLKVSHFDVKAMQEISHMQFNFECCGVSINDKMDENSTINETSPWNSWFRYQILGANYPYAMRWYYGLPHSCCKKLTTTDCEHIGMSRYLQRDRKQDVFFADEDKAIQIDWNAVTYDKTKERDSKAKNSIYPDDCKDIVVKNVTAKIRLIAYIIFAVCALLLISNVLMSAYVFFRRSVSESEQFAEVGFGFEVLDAKVPMAMASGNRPVNRSTDGNFEPDCLKDGTIPCYFRYGGNGTADAWKQSMSVDGFVDDLYELYSFLMTSLIEPKLNSSGMVLLYNVMQYLTRVYQSNVANDEELVKAFLEVHAMELNEWRGARDLPKLDADQIKQQYLSTIASQGENADTQQATPTQIQASSPNVQIQSPVLKAAISQAQNNRGPTPPKSVQFKEEVDRYLYSAPSSTTTSNTETDQNATSGDASEALINKLSNIKLEASIPGANPIPAIPVGGGVDTDMIDGRRVTLTPTGFMTKAFQQLKQADKPSQHSYPSPPPAVTAPKSEEEEKEDIPPDAPFRPFARPEEPKILMSAEAKIERAKIFKQQKEKERTALAAQQTSTNSLKGNLGSKPSAAVPPTLDSVNHYSFADFNGTSIEDLLTYRIALGQLPHQDNFSEGLKLNRPLGCSYDSKLGAGGTWLIADSSNNRVMCVAADNQITEYVGFRNPSAICVIEPGKSCAILNNDTIDHIDYQSAEIRRIGVELGGKCRGLVMSVGGNLITLCRSAMRLYRIDDMNKFMVVQLDFDPSSRPENPSFIAAYNDRVVFTDLATQMIQVIRIDDTDYENIKAQRLYVHKKVILEKYEEGGFQFVSGVQMDRHYRVMVCDAQGRTIQLFDDKLNFMYRVKLGFSMFYVSGFFINNNGETLLLGRSNNQAILTQLMPDKDVVEKKQHWTYHPRHNAGGSGPRQRNVSFNSQSSAGGGDHNTSFGGSGGLGFATNPGPSTRYFEKRF